MTPAESLTTHMPAPPLALPALASPTSSQQSASQQSASQRSVLQQSALQQLAHTPASSPQPTGEITGLIRAWQGGDPNAFNQLFTIIEPELRQMARKHLKGQGPNCSQQTGDLVNELYLRLVRLGRIEAQCRAQFFALAAHAIRCLLIDWARRRNAERRGGDYTRVEMDEAKSLLDQRADELQALDEALAKLRLVHPEWAQVAVLRYFVGLTISETAAVLGISPDTVVRRWNLTKAWLARELSRGNGAAGETAKTEAAPPTTNSQAPDNN